MEYKQAPSLKLCGITKTFPGVKALEDVSVSIEPGTVHALLGENGAGKSTLMNVLTGFIRADSGHIEVNGKTVDIASPLAAQSYGIGMVPQELSLIPALTVMENIRLGSFPRKWAGFFIDWRRTDSHAKEILSRLDDGISVRSLVRDLTTAHQQLVQIARAMAFGARILILDEPTACLTDLETEKLFAIISDFRQSGGSVIYISHRLEEITRICDTMTVLRDGKKVVDKAVKDTDIPEIIRYMVGRDMEASTRQESAVAAGKDVVLEVRNFEDGENFHHASFALHEGEILGFAGLIGAGRTELMRAVIGDLPARSGAVLLREGTELRETRFRHPNESIRRGVAYVPEERRSLAIFPDLSVKKNMTLSILRAISRFPLGIRFAKERGLSDRYYRDFNIRTPSLDTLIANLSGGNQQKAVLARCLLTECRVLILDEPTRGIDVNAKREIYDILRGLIAKGGISVILISSEMQELLDNADRIIVMHEGEIRGEVAVDGDTKQEDIMRLALH